MGYILIVVARSLTTPSFSVELHGIVAEGKRPGILGFHVRSIPRDNVGKLVRSWHSVRFLFL